MMKIMNMMICHNKNDDLVNDLKFRRKFIISIQGMESPMSGCLNTYCFLKLNTRVSVISPLNCLQILHVL